MRQHRFLHGPASAAREGIADESAAGVREADTTSTCPELVVRHADLLARLRSAKTPDCACRRRAAESTQREAPQASIAPLHC